MCYNPIRKAEGKPHKPERKLKLKNVLAVIDTETTNIAPAEKVTPRNNLVYNFGYKFVTPADGAELLTRSYIIDEIFNGEQERMQSAYYADKLPAYQAGIADGTYTVISFFAAMVEFAKLCEQYKVTAIVAHNARFDVDALNTTARWLTGLDYIRALPQKIEIWDSLKMAKSIFYQRPTYREFCQANGFMTKHATPRPQLTAEVLYRFITGDTNFEEEHTALADVLIETEIILACYRAHKRFEKVLFPA